MQKQALEVLQQAINRYLALDPESKTRLCGMQGKCVTIELVGTGLVLQLEFTAEKVCLKQEVLEKPDTYIKGTPLTMLRMALTQGDRKHFFAEDVSIEGNLDLGQQVIDLFDQLEIDWEEYLSRWTGDVPAHQFGRMLRKVKNMVQHTREILLQNVNEYAHEEAEWFPSEEALRDFFMDVDKLRMDVDRIEARILNLKKSGRVE
jgi:ubiquinone biosynthesis accessory factor UbiJ